MNTPDERPTKVGWIRLKQGYVVKLERKLSLTQKKAASSGKIAKPEKIEPSKLEKYAF